MGQVIDVPGHGPTEFPDDMTDEQIVAAIKKNSMGKRRSIPGDMGAALSAAEAFGALNKLLEDVAYSAGGKATDIASQKPFAASPETAAGVGYVTNLAAQAIPSFLSGSAVKSAVVEPMKNAGRWLMTKAVKPAQKYRESGRAEQAVETMLEKGISQWKGSFDQVENRVSQLNKELDEVLTSSEGRASTTAVANELAELLRRSEKRSLGQEEQDAIRKYWQRFVETHPENVSVKLANEIKRGDYKAIGDNPFLAVMGSPDLATKTKVEKALARGWQREIAAAEPRATPILKEQSDLINVLKVAGKRGDDNKNLMGLSLIAPNQAQLLAFLADRSARLNSLAARGIYSSADAVPFGVGMLGGAGLMAETGQAPDAERGALYRYLRGLLPPR